METRVIVFNPFGFKEGESHIMSEVINVGKFDGENFHYTTKYGLQVEPISKVDSSMTKVVNLTDIDYKRSLYWWFKDYPKESEKEVVLDLTLNKGLKYNSKRWHFGLFIQVTDDKILVNPNLTF